MFTNGPTSRHHIHALSYAWGESWSNFFFQRNILIGSFLFFPKKKYLFPTFFQTPLHFLTYFTLWNPLLIRFPSYFTLFVIFQLVILYIFFLYKWDNNWETRLEFFQRALSIFRCSSTQLDKPNLNSPWEPLHTCKCFFF